MTQKDERDFQLTEIQMQDYIRGGRSAIEFAMLLILTRPRVLNAEDDAEMSELKVLLKKYNEMMAKYESKHDTKTAKTTNDEQGAKE